MGAVRTFSIVATILNVTCLFHCETRKIWAHVPPYGFLALVWVRSIKEAAETCCELVVAETVVFMAMQAATLSRLTGQEL